MFYVEDDYKPSLKNRWNSQIRPSFFVCDFLNFADVFFWQKKHLERNTVIIQHGGFLKTNKSFGAKNMVNSNFHLKKKQVPFCLGQKNGNKFKVTT